MENKYFAKFLPTNEEIKEWDMSKYKKIKLFLCTHNIPPEQILGGGSNIYLIHNPKDKNEEKAFKVIGEISDKAIWVKEGDKFSESDILQKSESKMMEERVWGLDNEPEMTLEQYLEEILKEEGNKIDSYKIGDRYKWKDAEDEVEITFYYKEYLIKCNCCNSYK